MERSLRVISIFLLVYLFLVSIKLMGDSFELFGKGFANRLIMSCSNPVVGLFIGILSTTLVQSSSTTTSLVVALVGGGVLPVGFAIPIIMGANIGTTVTNTFASLSFLTRKEDFRRAFAGATVHDFFNLFSVILLFPLEIKFHLIQKAALLMTKMFQGAGGVKFTSPLKVIISPVVHAIKHLFLETFSLPRVNAGIFILGLSLIVMVGSLIYLVKTMRSLALSRAEVLIDRYLFRNDFLAMIVGLLLTILVQSSSITTCLIVPLVGAGIVTLRRCYPYTLGANIGTTCTALLASFATVSYATGSSVNTAGVTAAFAHLLFNIFGICVFYPLKRLPITCAGKLAEMAAESKKWAIIFVIAVFYFLPLLVIFVVR